MQGIFSRIRDLVLLEVIYVGVPVPRGSRM